MTSVVLFGSQLLWDDLLWDYVLLISDPLLDSDICSDEEFKLLLLIISDLLVQHFMLNLSMVTK